MNLDRIKVTLESAGVHFDNGLSAEEMAAAEQRFRFIFPDDLRRFLAYCLPIGRGCPNWRYPDDNALADSMAGPLEGICFDVQHNAFWLSEWGAKPTDQDAAFALVAKHVESAPKLIPIFGHRYIPDRPSIAGNPVFSVHQTDIIYYGVDLENYLHNEYHTYFGTPRYQLPGKIREIEFWSALAS